MNAAYARAGTIDSATRRLGLATAWHSGGRSSESACITWDTGLEYDEEMQGVFAEIKQSKISKAKLIVFVAGADRHCDWFLALGDYMTLHPPALYNSDEPSWMIPELHGTSSPGTKLGDWLKALRPLAKGGTTGYAGKGYSVPSLPDNVNAGGIRPGVSNFLSKYMPAELVCHMTGHDFRGASALYEYVDADRALALVGALVAAGWTAFPWGQHGDGPSPPSLDALRDTGEDVDALQETIDLLFNLDDASPPMLLSDGALRPMVHIAFASMIMYNDARMAAGEMRPACVKLMDLLKRAGITTEKLSEWGATIRAKFDTDNVHLTMGRTATGDGGTAQVIRALGRSLSEMKAELGALRRDLNTERRRSASAPPTPAHTTTSPIASPAGAAAPAAPPVAPAAAADAAPSAGPSGMGPLIPPVAGGTEPTPTPIEIKAEAGDFYANCMARGGALPPGLSRQDRDKGEQVMDWFNAMATDDEKLLLKPARPGHALPSSGDRRRTTERLHKLVVARLCAAFGQNVPRELGKGKLGVFPLDNRLRALKALKPSITVVPNKAAFAVWRSKHEADEALSQGSSNKRQRGTESEAPAHVDPAEFFA